MSGKPLRSGEVAAAAGVNVETLRYYERRGILAEPPRAASGYREYPREVVLVVRFVKRAQELGFTLEVIEELLALRNDDSRACGEVAEIARDKVAEIDGKLRSLRAMKRALATLVTACDAEASTRDCPILEALDQPKKSG